MIVAKVRGQVEILTLTNRGEGLTSDDVRVAVEGGEHVGRERGCGDEADEGTRDGNVIDPAAGLRVERAELRKVTAEDLERVAKV
jgi:hypothetical protein